MASVSAPSVESLSAPSPGSPSPWSSSSLRCDTTSAVSPFYVDPSMTFLSFQKFAQLKRMKNQVWNGRWRFISIQTNKCRATKHGRYLIITQWKCWLQLSGVEDGKHNEEYHETGSREDHHGRGEAIGAWGWRLYIVSSYKAVWTSEAHNDGNSSRAKRHFVLYLVCCITVLYHICMMHTDDIVPVKKSRRKPLYSDTALLSAAFCYPFVLW